MRCTWCADRFLVAERLSIGESFATLHEAIARAAIAVADAKRQRVEQNEAREVLQP